MDHPDVVPNLLLAARLLCEHRGDDARALKLLRQIEARFPDAPAIEEVRSYRAFVEQVSS